jgi:type IV pilus assembly protein PilO
MKLSRREQILLAALLIIGLLAAGFYLVYQPMALKHDELVAQKTERQSEYDKKLAEIAQVEPLKADINTLSGEINGRTGKFFPSIIQEQIMLLMNTLYDDSDVSVNSETFISNVGLSYPRPPSPPRTTNDAPDLTQISSEYAQVAAGQLVEAEAPTEEAAGAAENDLNAADAAVRSVQSLGQNVAFNATYAQAIDLISRIESLNRSIQVRNLVMSVAETATAEGEAPVQAGLLDCTFDLVFNAIPKLTAQDSAYEAWDLTGDYGKGDPFDNLND